MGPRGSLDLALLWLWCRPAAAALIQPLAWELPYAVSAALKNQPLLLCSGPSSVTLIFLSLVNLQLQGQFFSHFLFFLFFFFLNEGFLFVCFCF